MSYQYPTSTESKGQSTSISYTSWVTEADPEWQSKKHNEVEYITSRRIFYHDPYVTGAYGP